MRQTGWYRVIFNEKPQFAFYDSNGDFWYVILVMSTIPNHMITVLDEELQNPEPIKRTDFAGFVNPKKTGLDGDGHPIEVR